MWYGIPLRLSLRHAQASDSASSAQSLCLLRHRIWRHSGVLCLIAVLLSHHPCGADSRPRLRTPQKQQALLGQMLMEGYGCDRDPVAGREWIDKAKRRGYRMEGVYCEL